SLGSSQYHAATRTQDGRNRLQAVRAPLRTPRTPRTLRTWFNLDLTAARRMGYGDLSAANRWIPAGGGASSGGRAGGRPATATRDPSKWGADMVGTAISAKSNQVRRPLSRPRPHASFSHACTQPQACLRPPALAGARLAVRGGHA